MVEVEDSSPGYRSLRQFNTVRIGSFASSRAHISTKLANRFFTSDSLQDKLVRELACEKVLPIKEVLESFEFFARARKHVRAEHLADVCCGHGLTGILFALFERSVERVTLIDRQQPPSYEKTLACAKRVGPWIVDKIRFERAKLDQVIELLSPGTSVVAIHACGKLTDRCIDYALAAEGAIGLMPCCYPYGHCEAPAALRLKFGTPLAFDIHRTYRLENAGYHVRWDEIPEEITPMNRVIIANKRSEIKR